jgi:type IV pilus assembly protein PilO
MAMNFNELSGLKQWGAVIVGGALVTAALYFTVFKSQNDKNVAAEHALQTKVRENNELESYRPKLKDMDRQLANLKQQLEIEARIVPNEKSVDGFIEMLDAEAVKAGVELRRYTAKPVVAKDYYSEVPFELELDGPYYSMLNFFDRVGKLERIVNVSGLLVSNTKNPQGAKTKHTYQYAPNESVVATFTATTFFSHELDVPAAAAPGAKPATAAATAVASK